MLSRRAHLLADIVLLGVVEGVAQFPRRLGILLFALGGDAIHLFQQLAGAFLKLLLCLLYIVQIGLLFFGQLRERLAIQPLLLGELLDLGLQAFLLLQQPIGLALDFVRTGPRLQAARQQIVERLFDFLLGLASVGQHLARLGRIAFLVGVPTVALRLLAQLARLLRSSSAR